MTNILDTGIRNARNVHQYTIGNGAIHDLSKLLEGRRATRQPVVYFIDEFFQDDIHFQTKLKVQSEDKLFFISTKDEPTTEYIDSQVTNLRKHGIIVPSAIIGIGGGTTMDVAKAVSNLMTNGGKAEDYQGWDLVKQPGIYKIAIPTLSGTGAEATRTCVMTNKQSGLKLGMNSDYTVFDQIIMDPELTKTVPKNQYFHTGMDAYIHCIEALNGSYRNAIGDAFSEQTIILCRDVFNTNEMMSDENRSKMMVASYLGGCAIATSYVGVVHPFSAGLSVVLGIHHCIANCITMRAMEEFYPSEYKEFWKMVEKQGVDIPERICRNLTDEQYDQLYASTVIHEKPLTNALGENFKEVLTKEKVIDLFKRM
ncbi:MAG: iron-containing alcohol dehydrogenase [Candidatus Scalindua sp.]|jgi:3-deoxy-alpha-D-manno-octulosonate 8-oxidase|nr:iron-containing alcohol dehydrogenase [Candidatus Scalindua sp.]